MFCVCIAAAEEEEEEDGEIVNLADSLWTVRTSSYSL